MIRRLKYIDKVPSICKPTKIKTDNVFKRRYLEGDVLKLSENIHNTSTFIYFDVVLNLFFSYGSILCR